ncbi:MAG: PQQ-dependent sugar dehydrogenase [Nitrososphaeraceae archaeon]|nr:PQQ-dependent sugar dehydrogenase [Nitrososphaeraceae archaeon]MDW0333061.1 PQQ-dependent sugar dehydrogenase [Nitrososphaeraceae archaeon]
MYKTNLANPILDYSNFLVFLFLLLLSPTLFCSASYGSEGPSLSSKKLVAEKVVGGLETPTGIAFIGENDILAVEKNSGKVLRILNGDVLPEPLIDVNVANEVERGLLGISVANNSANSKLYVFLFYTEAQDRDGSEAVGNRLYRYELTGNKLINPKLLLDLPFLPGPAHNGGVVTVGPDNHVYVVVGNLLASASERFEGNSLDQNIENGNAPDGRGGILTVTQDGDLVNGGGILGDEPPLDLYYAYGIRNSFGLTFDPVSGHLWDTENGGAYDEINLVEPGFNSGWEKVNGKASLLEDFDQDELVDFGGKGKYSDPEFSWASNSDFRTAPTSIVFFDSDKFGEQYKDGVFVGDVRGNIYHFDVDKDRTDLLLNGPLADEVANDFSEIEDLIFARFPGVITDMKVGPDGYLYILLYQVLGQEDGELYRIVPSNT